MKYLAIPALILLAACSNSDTPEERRAKIDAAISIVQSELNYLEAQGVDMPRATKEQRLVIHSACTTLRIALLLNNSNLDTQSRVGAACIAVDAATNDAP